MRAIFFSIVLLMSLTLQARTIDAEVIRLVGDEDGTKIIVKAENQNQIVFLKKDNTKYSVFLSRLQSAQANRYLLKIKIEKQGLQILKDIESL